MLAKLAQRFLNTPEVARAKAEAVECQETFNRTQIGFLNACEDNKEAWANVTKRALQSPIIIKA